MDRNDTQKAIESGKTVLGVEFGSTRIKAVLIGEDHMPIASGSHEWENRYENGIWTYSLEDVWTGLQESYRNLSNEVFEKYNTPLKTIGAIGFSAMMHGYLAFDKDGNLLVPFRTWRNTITGQAAEKLTDLFQFNIPQRWSIAHLYQAILNKEPHVKDISHLTTLAGYVHWKLTGQKVLGVGEASGMFPIDSTTNDYDERMLELFNERLEGGKHLVETPGHPAQSPCRRRCRRRSDRRRRKAARSHGTTASGYPALSARGRRRHGHGRDQQRCRANGQCFRRNIRLCHDRVGKGSVEALSRDRHGDDAHRQACRHGP